jgi:hypothetical protein
MELRNPTDGLVAVGLNVVLKPIPKLLWHATFSRLVLLDIRATGIAEMALNRSLS